MSRPDCPPGTIIEHRQRFVVRTDRYGQHHRKYAGARKLEPMGDVERIVIGARWRVERRDGWSTVSHPTWGVVWRTRIASHASAIAYADRLARQEQR